MVSQSSVPIITHPENEYRFLPPSPPAHTRFRLREKKNTPLVDLIVQGFEGIPEDRLLFGSLIYPTAGTSYRRTIRADLSHFLQRVLRHVPRRRYRHHQFQRQFFIEKSEGAGSHAHFLMEVFSGMSPEEMTEILCDKWRQIALRERHEKEYWARLNQGSRYSIVQPRRVLVQDHIIPLVKFAPDTGVRDHTSYRKLAVVKPVTTDAGGLRGVVKYCLKWEGQESAFRSGEVVFEQSTAKWIKGHTPSLALQ